MHKVTLLVIAVRLKALEPMLCIEKEPNPARNGDPPVTLALERLRQEDCEFRASLGKLVRQYL